MTVDLQIDARQLDRCELELLRVSLGCGSFGGIGSAPEFFGQGLDDEQAFALMDVAWEMGIRHFDTADAYGGGRSEAAIGRWMRARGVRPLITTKTFNPMQAGADQGLAPERVRRQLHGSLQRLGVDRVDVYLAHEPDPAVAPATVVQTFERLRGEGLVRATGVSNHGADALRAALAAGPFDVVQNSFSLLVREDEDEVIGLCASAGVAYCAFSPLAGGWLTGKYRRGEPYPAGSRMTQRPEGYAAFLAGDVYDGLERLAALADERGVSTAGLALSWLLAEPDIAQIVLGPMRVEHLTPVREALAHPLDERERAAIGALFPR